MQKFRTIPFIQALYFLTTALWPFIHLESFLWVTGGKTDIWLLKTVSILLLPYCLLLFYLAVSDRKNHVMVYTVILCSFGLMAIELYYYLKNVIKWVYLADAALQFLFICYWIFYILKLKKDK